jgi:branched-chain amino acid transport system ATP-binding protein
MTATEATGALVLDKVSKAFGGVVAARDVDASIPPGRITGLIGPNGAGKTTIVNLITGMLSLTAGRILLAGRDLSTAPAEEVGRAGVARTFQNIRLLSEASVLDNVMIGFHRHERCSLVSALLSLPSSRRESANMRDGAMALLDRFEMKRFANHPAGSLAYGHQRRVEMMRALGSSPRVLLLDEPVAGMNDVEANELGEIFRALAGGGMAVLLIEHNMRFVTSLCQHVYVLDSGRMIASGAPREVVRDPAVIAAYLGS